MRSLMLGLVGLADFLLTGLTVALGLAGWRLVTGPIEIDFLTPHLEHHLTEALAGDMAGIRVSADTSLIRWDGLRRPVRLVITDA